MYKKKLIYIKFFLFFIFFTNISLSSETNLLKQEWSFKGLTGKFDRSSLQRGYQVYNEVCASCHSMNLLSYRNLGEEGGPEFSLEQVKAIADNFEVTDWLEEENANNSFYISTPGFRSGVKIKYTFILAAKTDDIDDIS